MTVPDDTRNRYLIHLPIDADDLPTATQVARAVARSLGFHSRIDQESCTVTTADQPDQQHPVFCPQRLPNGRRCLLRPDHDGPCQRRLPR